MTKEIYVTVVIPLFNKGKYILRALKSVTSQTHRCFEIIVVNDGSTDNGREVVARIKDERVRVIDQDNKGESAARNKGIAEAKYELIAFLDADDVWEPEFLENYIYAAVSYPNAGMIGSAYSIVNSEGDLCYPDFKNVPQEQGYIDDFFMSALSRNPVCSSAAVVRKSVFNEIGGFPEDMHFGPDSYMWSKVALNYPIAFINKYLAIIHEDSHNRVTKNYDVVNDFPLIEYYASLKKTIDEDKLYFMKEYTYHKYLLISARYLRNGDRIKARVFLLKAKYSKLWKRLYILGKLALILPAPVLIHLISIWDKNQLNLTINARIQRYLIHV